MRHNALNICIVVTGLIGFIICIAYFYPLHHNVNNLRSNKPNIYDYLNTSTQHYTQHINYTNYTI